MLLGVSFRLFLECIPDFCGFHLGACSSFIFGFVGVSFGVFKYVFRFSGGILTSFFGGRHEVT